MKIRHIIILAVFIGVNLLIILSLAKGKPANDGKTTANKGFVTSLKATKIENDTAQFNIVGFGTVSSFNAADISSEVQGNLSQGKNPIKPGVEFKKGDLLFRINDRDAQYNLRAKKSNFINLLANLLPDLRIDFSDQYSKWENYINSIKLNEPLPELPVWRTEKEKVFLSTRNVLTEYFTIKSQEEQLSKYAVYAPFSGVITDTYTTDNSVVNPGSKIMRIVETNNFEIPVSIPAGQLGAVKKGTEASIYTTEGELKGKGTVIRISEVINRNTQSVKVYIRPTPLKGENFIEGEYVSVEINQKEMHEGVRLPGSAINNGQVFVYSPKDSTLQKQPVKVSDKNDEGVFIKGLKDGQIVITQEVLNYTDSSKYTILIQ